VPRGQVKGYHKMFDELGNLVLIFYWFNEIFWKKN
jgi:hypothetical protein